MPDAAEDKKPLSSRALNKAVDEADAIVVRLQSDRAVLDGAIAESEAKSLVLSDAAIAQETGPQGYAAWVEVEKQAEDLRRKRKFTGRQLVKAEADAAEAARVRREFEYEARIGRNEGFFGLNDPKPGTLIGEAILLEAAIAECVKRFRNMIRISRDKIAPSFVGTLPPSGLGLNVGEIILRVECQNFRAGHDPFLGGPATRQQASYPGGRAPNLQVLGLPETVRSMSDEYRVYAKFASDIQRGKRRWDGQPPEDFTPEKVAARERRRQAMLSSGIDSESLQPIAKLPTASAQLLDPTEPAALPDTGIEDFEPAAPDATEPDGPPVEIDEASYTFTDPATGRVMRSSVPNRVRTAAERETHEKASLARAGGKRVSADEAAASIASGRRRTRIGSALPDEF